MHSTILVCRGDRLNTQMNKQIAQAVYSVRPPPRPTPTRSHSLGAMAVAETHTATKRNNGSQLVLTYICGPRCTYSVLKPITVSKTKFKK